MRLLILILLLSVPAAAQTISGIVVDTRGDAIGGAEIIVESGGVFERTVTDESGRFSIGNASGRVTISAAGFETAARPIDGGHAEPLTITLQPSAVVGNVNVSIAGGSMRQTDAAASIAVINTDSLDVAAARTIDDMLRQVAGFQLFRRSSSRTTNPTAQGGNLRGLSGSGASRASVVFDALSVNDAFGGWTYWSRVPQISVEQIEVLRGGASSFYGSGGLSGAINIVPLSLSDGEKTRLKIESSAASQNTADASGVLLATRRGWEADLIGEIFKTAGYIPVEESARGAVDSRAASRHSNLILKLGRRFGEKNRAFVRGSIFGERRDNGTRFTHNRTYFRQLAAGADLDNVTARLSGEWQVYDQTFSSVAADRNSESSARVQRVSSSAYAATLSWRKIFAGHAVAAGGAFLSSRGFSDEVGFFAGRPTGTSRAGGEARDISLFASDNWNVAPKLILNLAARFDHRRNSDGVSITRTFATGAVAETRFADRGHSAFSPRVGAVYEVARSVSIYGAFARSFRAPSLNELYRGFRVGSIVTEANAFLIPERADTFEAGASATLFDRKLIMRAIGYSTRVKDPVVSITLSTTPMLITRRRENVGSTTSRGLEVEVESQLSRQFRASFSYLLVDSLIESFPTDRSLEGNRLPQVLRQSVAAQLRYDFRDRWTISTQLRAASSQFEDDRNTLRLRRYFTADARIGYRLPYFVEVFVSAENLLNARYDIAATPVRSVAAPRLLRLGLRFNSSTR